MSRTRVAGTVLITFAMCLGCTTCRDQQEPVSNRAETIEPSGGNEMNRATIISAAAFVCGVAAGCDSSSANGPPGIEASVTEGVAPLLVHFDAASRPPLDSSNAFLELDYEWEFGEDEGRVWEATGAPRAKDYGPVAAHVYETPGTYTARVRVRDGKGNNVTQSVTITVRDPDVVFAGADTIVFSGAGDFADAPDGALQVTTADFDEAMGHIATGKRLLFRRGETFSASRTSGVNVAGPGSIGAFGAGSPPRLVQNFGGEFIAVSERDPQFRDWRIADLHFDGEGAADTVAVSAGGMVRDLLLFRLRADAVASSFRITLSIIEYYDREGTPGHDFHDNVGIVECVHRGGAGNDFIAAFFDSARGVFMGNDMDMAGAGQHVLRSSLQRGGVISHNRLSNASGGTHVLKLHAPNYQSDGIAGGNYTENTLVRANAFDGATNDWTVEVCSENSTTDQRLRNIIVDGNFFRSGSGTQVGLILCPVGAVVRNNIFDLTPGNGGSCIQTIDPMLAPPAGNLAIYHNTCHSEDGGEFRLFASRDRLSSAAALNNLVSGPGPNREVISSDIDSDADIVDEGNLSVEDGGYSVEPPLALGDFKLGDSSPASDSALAGEVQIRDLEGTLRPEGSAPDVGAYED